MRRALLVVFVLVSLTEAAAQMDSGETFKAGVTVIQVPVTVRDRDGNVVSNLGKDDFQLFDNGKRQEIVSFSVETPASQAAPGRSLPDPSAAAAQPTTGTPVEIPARFVAYFFDDLSISDLTRVREAAAQQFDALKPGDRAAIFTTSCHIELDFTNDRQKLQETVARMLLKQSPLCRVSRSQTLQIELLKAVVKKMSTLPARRDIVFVSSGFFVGPDRSNEEAELIDSAGRSKVSINTIDVGGFSQGGGGDNSSVDPLDPAASMIRRSANMTNPEVLIEMAHGTGGTYLQGNDYALSFRKLATPESHYVLGFVPNGRADGRFHQLKVKLENPHKLSVEARSGYVASKSPE
jgi:VWFA-related protein